MEHSCLAPHAAHPGIQDLDLDWPISSCLDFIRGMASGMKAAREDLLPFAVLASRNRVLLSRVMEARRLVTVPDSELPR